MEEGTAYIVQVKSKQQLTTELKPYLTLATLDEFLLGTPLTCMLQAKNFLVVIVASAFAPSFET